MVPRIPANDGSFNSLDLGDKIVEQFLERMGLHENFANSLLNIKPTIHQLAELERYIEMDLKIKILFNIL